VHQPTGRQVCGKKIKKEICTNPLNLPAGRQGPRAEKSKKINLCKSVKPVSKKQKRTKKINSSSFF
jgi:hypothetical protein